MLRVVRLQMMLFVIQTEQMRAELKSESLN